MTPPRCASLCWKRPSKAEKNCSILGTGSGILAIAAGMLGANPDTAVDIDAHCLTCAQENAARNGVTIARTLHGDALRDPALAREIGGGYDIICANIVADIIIGMAPMFYEKLVPGGTLIASGILAERAEEVGRGAYARRLPSGRACRFGRLGCIPCQPISGILRHLGALSTKFALDKRARVC